jgi:hypothetical protein
MEGTGGDELFLVVLEVRHDNVLELEDDGCVDVFLDWFLWLHGREVLYG